MSSTRPARGSIEHWTRSARPRLASMVSAGAWRKMPRDCGCSPTRRAAVALLTAPESGREPRDRLKDMAKDAAGKAARVPPSLHEAYARAARAAREAFIETLEDRTPEGGPTAGRGGH